MRLTLRGADRAAPLSKRRDFSKLVTGNDCSGLQTPGSTRPRYVFVSVVWRYIPANRPNFLITFHTHSNQLHDQYPVTGLCCGTAGCLYFNHQPRLLHKCNPWDDETSRGLLMINDGE